MAIHDATLEALATEAEALVTLGALEACAGTRDEYMCALLMGALAAWHRGDYPIAAIAALRRGDTEILSLASNTMFSRSDPRGHAEANAISQLVGLTRANRDVSRRLLHPWPGLQGLGTPEQGLYVRRIRAVQDNSASVLYTSLEPCPMCTVVVLNAGIHRVVVGEVDNLAGALAPSGVHDMPPLWLDVARRQGLEVDYVSSEGEDDLASRAAALTNRLFVAARREMDDGLGEAGLLARDDFRGLLNDLLGRGQAIGE